MTGHPSNIGRTPVDVFFTPDIENGFGERNKYDEYLELEKEKNKQVFDLLQEYLRIKKEAFDIYELQHLWLSDFVVQLTSNND